jgi:hypothetical protein
MGMTKAQAASLAKNLTVNFNRRGEWGVWLNSLYLFYNASIQGSARMFTALGNPRVQKFAAGAVIAGFALDALNGLISGEDDDEEKFYDKIPEYEKSRNLIVMMPGSSRYLKIPLPYGYNVFYGIGRSGSEIFSGKRWEEAAGHLLTTIAESFNPIGGAETLANFVAPTFLDPVVDIQITNRDFADRPIMPDQSPYGPPEPDNQRYWNSVAPHWKAITDTLNQGTGGDEVVPGAIDVSPETLEYLFGYATGAAGSFVDRAWGLAEKITAGDEIEANDLPMVRKLVGDKPGWYDKAA